MFTVQDRKSPEEYKANPLPDDLTFHSIIWDGSKYIARFEGSFQDALDPNNPGFDALAD